MSITLLSPAEISMQTAKNLRTKRLDFNLSQQSLAKRAGVSYGVLKKFERTGKISLESLLKLALVLNSLQDFESLFRTDEPMPFITLDELIKDRSRKRGRQ